ncbi:MAG: hypothetical protein QM541_03875 [Flavobacterium sp.]|nr:hypothetical protein [Flavobacterium sp.]
MELVDHLADIIEQLQKENINLCFNEALEIAGKQFTDAEFTTIVKSKKKLLQVKMSKMIEEEFKTFFTLPRLIGTASLLLLCLILPKLYNYWETIMPIVFFLFFTVFLVFYYGRIPARESRAIKGAEVLPLLSFKIKSKYEIFIQTMQILLPLYNLSELNYHKGLFSNSALLSPSGILFMQTFLVSLVLFEILIIAVENVKYSVYNKLWDDYPKAFVS